MSVKPFPEPRRFVKPSASTTRALAWSAMLALVALALAAAQDVAGVVVGPDRQPLPNIRISLYGPRQNEPAVQAAAGAAAGAQPSESHGGDALSRLRAHRRRIAETPAAPADSAAVAAPTAGAIQGAPVRDRLAQGVTDARGRFSLSVGRGQPALLALHGPDGVGRIALDKPGTASLTLVYPVRTTIVLLHDNDHHFHFGARDAIAKKLQEIRQRHDHVFLLNAGDIFMRRPNRWRPRDSEDYYAERSLFMITTMNELGYDAMTPGNHELDYIGRHTLNALGAARFPLLAANIQVSTDLLPQPLPYVTLATANDITLALLGLSTVNFKKEGVAETPPAHAVRDHLKLKDTHDVFVVLSHIGIGSDRKLAGSFDEIDVIVGGHSHTLLEEAVTVNGVLIAQAGQHNRHMGKITLELENERIVSKKGVVFPLVASPERR